MHIADITMFYAPESGGVKRYLLAKRAWLQARPGFRHTLLVPGRRDRDAGAEIRPLHSVPIPGANGYRLPLGCAHAHRELCRLAPDVIEAGDAYFYAHAALAAGRELNVPTVAFCHSDLPGLARRWLWAGPARAVRRYVRAVYSRFDLVLAASNVVEDSLRETGLGNIGRQPLGVDTSVFHPGTRDPNLRRKLALPPDVRLLVFAGRYSPEKNLWVLERAMQRLGPKYVALTVGSGSHPARCANAVQLPYQSDAAALARVLASCDAFVHPGDQETFGLVALEAMACGLPVIGANAGGVRELIDDSVGITVRPRDPDALRDAVEQLFAGDRASLAANARARVVARHDWNAVMPGLIAHYRCLRRARARHGRLLPAGRRTSQV